MTTLTTAPEGRRTFILSMAASLALLSIVGLLSTLSDSARPPVIADRTPPGVRDAVIIPVDQYDSIDASPVVAIAVAEPPAPAPVAAKLAKTVAAKPVTTALALAVDSKAEPASDEITAAPGHPIKIALAMAPETAEAATVR